MHQELDIVSLGKYETKQLTWQQQNVKAQISLSCLLE